MTCEESHTGPSIVTLFLFAESRATGHVPNTLHIIHQKEVSSMNNQSANTGNLLRTTATKRSSQEDC
jgi:hypothetical protein